MANAAFVIVIVIYCWLVARQHSRRAIKLRQLDLRSWGEDHIAAKDRIGLRDVAAYERPGQPSAKQDDCDMPAQESCSEADPCAKADGRGRAIILFNRMLYGPGLCSPSRADEQSTYPIPQNTQK